MKIDTLIMIAVYIIAFISHAAYIKGSLTEKIKANSDDIKEIRDDITRHKETVRYKDTCESMYAGHEIRLSRIEKVTNGRG
jgi:hypothetical protein